MQIKDQVNPIGAVVEDEGIKQFIESMSMFWDSLKEDRTWWQFWKRSNLVKVTDFLLKSLDDLIAYVDGFVVQGTDKKATVLDAIGKLYDYVIREAMPIWLKPFSGYIKDFIINTVISAAIDWIVEKYKNGNWRKKEPQEVLGQWVQMKAQLCGVPGGHRPS